MQPVNQAPDRATSLLGRLTRCGTWCPKLIAAVTSGSAKRYTSPPSTRTPSRKTSKVAPPWDRPLRRRKRVAGVNSSVMKKAMTT